MWQFITQNWWTFLFIAIMVFMHRPGGAGCCGGGRKHGQWHDSPKKDLQDKSVGEASCCGERGHGQQHISLEKELQDKSIGEAACCGGLKSK